MIKILIVEDNSDLNRTLCRHLTLHDYQTVGCLTAQEAYDAMDISKFDIIISDIMMPDIDGFEFAKSVRELNTEIPIIFMTARGDIESKTKGFHIGIDDYLTKPVDLDELLLRIEAILRRAKITTQKKMTVGSLVLDEEAIQATLRGEDLNLTTKEFQLLFKLLSYPNHVFTRNQLLELLGGMDNESGPRSIDVFITNIRGKTRECTDMEIKTVRGIGYKAVIK